MTVRTMFGLQHRISLTQARATYFVASYVGANDVESSRLVLRDDDDRVILRLDSKWWNRAQVVELASALDDVIALPGGLSRKQLIKQFPQVTTFAERRPWVSTAILIGGALAFGIAVVAVLTPLAP